MAFSETHKRWVSDAVPWFCEGDLPGLNIFTLSSTQAFLCFLSQTADATTFRQIWRTQRWGGTVRIRWALQKNLLQQLECSYHIGCFVWPLSTPFLKQVAGERGQMKSVWNIIFRNCKNNFQTLSLRAWGCVQPLSGRVSFQSFLHPFCFCCLHGSCPRLAIKHSSPTCDSSSHFLGHKEW